MRTTTRSVPEAREDRPGIVAELKSAWHGELRPLGWIAGIFLVAYFVPFESARVQAGTREAFGLLQEYAREHVVFGLLPAFLIAGAIGLFVSQAAVLRYLGPDARPVTAYGVAAVSGSILTVCSCSILPLFTAIYKRGAGLGPAAAFLYSGPAINALAIILTARILGLEIGIARAVAAVVFSVVVGLVMFALFRREEAVRREGFARLPIAAPRRSLGTNALILFVMIAILIFANWSPQGSTVAFWQWIGERKWTIVGVLSTALGVLLVRWMGVSLLKVLGVGAATLVAALAAPGHPIVPFSVGIVGLVVVISSEPGEPQEWWRSSWQLTKDVLPLLLVGIVLSGLLFGRPGHEALIPSEWVERAVGGEGVVATAVASVLGAFMYFATCTEVPILQGLRGAGMGNGPSLALLLAGPALSLPSILVLRSVLGARKVAVYVSVVVVLSIGAGLLFGALFPATGGVTS